MELLELADRLWRGEARIEDHHPLRQSTPLVEVADGVGFMQVMSNVCVIRTADGLVLVDSGTPYTAAHVHSEVRRWADDPVRVVVFSHGHIDHVFGVDPFDREAAERGWLRPMVVAHAAVPARFARYRRTPRFNANINMRQFGIVEGLEWPTEYREPDVTYHDRLSLTVGGERLELHHARGETDDHTWTWVPSRRVLCCGDLIIWACPNAGNPQKVQRYPLEWAQALRAMAALDAEVLLPGHGFPVVGADRVRRILDDTAALLESLHDQTVAMMEAGCDLDEILHTVRAPDELLTRPWLRPVYDEPEFIVRNIWRYYGGWWDGDPATLMPAPRARLAAELAALAGGAELLARRARVLLERGELRLAGHLAELAALAAPEDPAVHAVRAEVYERRRDAATSTMARGIFDWAARTSRARLD